MTDLPDTAGGRFLRLAGLSARVGADAARHRLSRLWQRNDEQAARDAEHHARIGLDIARTLGSMKGAVMKVGQVVSQYRDVLPPALVDALTPLQRDAPPRPFAEIRERLVAIHGTALETHFSHITETPLAAASLAQVHRARLADGREVVLKVQYPGVAATVAADLRQLRIALRMARVLPVSTHLLDALFAEIRINLESELDYRLEAEALQRFGDFHRDDPRVVIPDVITALSTPELLVMTHEPGDSFATAGETYPQTTRDALGATLFRTLSRQLFVLGSLHCDPHPGNFATRPDGTLVIYDFGCLKQVPPLISRSYLAMIAAVQADDAAQLAAEMVRIGARNTVAVSELPAGFYDGWIALARELLDDRMTDFATLPLAERVVALVKAGLPAWRAFQPVPDTVMINRAMGGHYWNLRELGARVNLGAQLASLLPQRAAASGT